MIGRASVDGGDAVELFGEKESRKFVLKDERREREDVVGGLTGCGEVTIRGADKVGDFFDIGTFFPLRHQVRKVASGWFFAAFVQHDTKRSLRSFEQSLGDSFGRAVFQCLQRELPIALESVEIFFDADFGKREGGLADDDDTMLHSLRECLRNYLFPRASWGR